MNEDPQVDQTSNAPVEKMENPEQPPPYVRYIKHHMCGEVNSQLTIAALDEPGPGGANHWYQIRIEREQGLPQFAPTYIQFQKGGIKEAGVNGLTHEALLAIVIDRLRSFQNGPFPSEDNARALSHIEQGLEFLHARTRERQARGVEGVSQA